MKTILVTGAGGYIGSVATDLLLSKGYKVVGLDNFEHGYEDVLLYLQEKYSKEILTYYDLDLQNDISTVFAVNEIDAVIHYGALCSVSESVSEPEKYFSNNVCGTQNLLTSMFKHGVKDIIFSSTCAVYAPAQYMPLDEKHPTGPESPYGESKRIMEQMMEWYGKLDKLNYVILRYFNVCGANDKGDVGDSKKPSPHLVQNAVRGALGIEEFFLTCPKVETPDGTPIRDYINVVDLNKAHLMALEYLLNGGKNEIINLGTGTGNSVLEIIKTVGEVTGHTFDLKTGETRKGEATKMIADTKRAKRVLGWEPTHTLKDSVNSLIAWYKSHPNGWVK